MGPCALFGYILNAFRKYLEITQYSVLIFTTNNTETVESTDALPGSTADRTDWKVRSVRNHVSVFYLRICFNMLIQMSNLKFSLPEENQLPLLACAV